MNCPMKELLKEKIAATNSTAIATATTKTCVYASTATTKTSLNDSTTTTTTAATASTAAGKNGMNVSDGKKGVNCPAAEKIACTECCALLAFKYIAACEDVVEFQRKVREVMRK